MDEPGDEFKINKSEREAPRGFIIQLYGLLFSLFIHPLSSIFYSYEKLPYRDGRYAFTVKSCDDRYLN